MAEVQVHRRAGSTAGSGPQVLRRELRRADQCGRLMESDPPFDPLVWARLGTELGVLGLAVPESDGGVGGTPRRPGHRRRRRTRRGPGLRSGVRHGAAWPSRRSSPPSAGPVRDELLGVLAEGRRTAAFAVPDRAGEFDPAAVNVIVAERRGTLTGTVERVVDGGTADVLLVAATGPDGVALYAVEATEPGVQRTPLVTLDLTRPQATVISTAAPGATGGRGRDEADRRDQPRACQVGSALLAVEQVGAAQHLLDLSVEYAKSRLQFGRQIGSFQAVKHRLADCLVDVEHARSAAYHAVVGADRRHRRPRAGREHRAGHRIGGVRQVATDTIQVHGGIGFTWEHQAHLYFKRATTDAALLGSAEAHRSRVAELVLDDAPAERAPWVATGTK